MAPRSETVTGTLQSYFLVPFHMGAVLEVWSGICKGRWALVALFLLQI